MAGDGGIDSSSSESVGNKVDADNRLGISEYGCSSLLQCTTPYQTPTNTPAPAGTREDEVRGSIARIVNVFS